MKLKKIASLALAGIMAVSMLTACGEGDSNSTVTPPVDNTTSTGLSAQLGAEASDLTNSKVTFADSTALNNALKHAVGNIGDRTISQAFRQGINDVTYLGNLQAWGAVAAAVGVLEDDMDVDVAMLANENWTVNGLNPTDAQYDENNYNTVMLFAVDSTVSANAAVAEVAADLNDEIGELAINNIGDTNDQMHYSYTGSVSVATKTLTENHGMGMHIVAVQITRSAHA